MDSQWEHDPTKRFSNRVDNYVKYRPTYPHEILEFLTSKFNFDAGWTVADIGSGTGIFTRLLLENGNEVFAVEPNDRMRQVSESAFAGTQKFHSVRGTAEATTLPANGCDIIMCAQAFHWFDLERSRTEFRRILKGPSVVALIWNDRRTDGTPFLLAYEAFLQNWGIDYKKVWHGNLEKEHAFDRFFGEGKFELFTCENSQIMDFEGLKGRLLSSSYAPHEYHPKYADMLRDLESLFHKHAKGGEVEILYDTKVFVGTL